MVDTAVPLFANTTKTGSGLRLSNRISAATCRQCSTRCHASGQHHVRGMRSEEVRDTRIAAITHSAYEMSCVCGRDAGGYGVQGFASQYDIVGHRQQERPKEADTD